MRIPGLNLSATDEGIAWRETQSPGVAWFLVAAEDPDPAPPGAAEEADGVQQPAAARGATVLIRMEPGCGYPAHRHLDVEEVWVLAGGYRDERGTYRSGEYVRYPAGSAHHPVALGDRDQPIGAANPVCLLLASARGGIEILGSE